MTTLFWDPFAGIAGNMAVASLLDLGADPERLRSLLAAIPFPEGRLGLIIERRVKNGISAMYFNTVDEESWAPPPLPFDHDHSEHHEHPQHPQHPGNHSEHDHQHPQDEVGEHAYWHDHPHDHSHDHLHGNPHDHPHGNSHDHPHDHPHEQIHDHLRADNGCPRQELPRRGFADIRELIEKIPLTPSAQERALAIFRALGEAEARVHGEAFETIHFHEVGARDSIADIVGTAICLDELGITSVFTAPIHLGTGFTQCQHGTFPVPPPAVALLLEGYPVFTLPGIRGELTTPTGAALLRGLDARPGMPPGFCYDRIGYGAGTKEFGVPNVLRAFFARGNPQGRTLEGVIVLETNLDNATGELLAHAAECLMSAGALDVTLTPMQMKKGRPATLFSVISRPETLEALEELIYRELPTLGIRRHFVQRSILAREPAVVNTPFGSLQAKRIHEIDGNVRTSIEFESRRNAAMKARVALRKIPDHEE
ncbi:MAG: LarC family nickel insertion protein [Candidatus Ozemobacteraceae bacterium]